MGFCLRFLCGCGLLPAAGLAAQEPAHPFILWTPAEAAAIRQKIETQPGAKAEYERLVAGENNTFVNLFKYQVMGDEKAGQAERNYLLTFINAKVDSRRWSDHYLSVLRYDVLYDKLSPEQRQQLEATFRRHIQYELDNPYRNNRVSLLPNMQLPRRFSAHLMTVVLRDEKLIRAMWAVPSGFQWFFDEYLSDGMLYNEEFAKMTSLIGELLIYCRGLERLGLHELGYGFTGRGGATMRAYVESYLALGYPRTEIPGGLPRYERVAMGDARGHLMGIFQHANVPGCFPKAPGPADEGGKKGEARSGRWPLFYAANMNGRDHRDDKVTKLQFPNWFEILQAQYPDGPCAYFLAQMRRPEEARYYPTPFWGLDPIDPAAVKPPPAPSRVFPERGFAMLRADESPAYWESPAPAVALQFATLYVHYTADCFSLLGYHALNRPLYVNRAISAGYNGGPWDFSVRGHCGVLVDGLQAQPIGTVPTRHLFAPRVKFVSARGVQLHPGQGYQGAGEVRSSDQPKVPATQVYPGVDLSRSLFLTREYLLDIYQLKSDQPRLYHWLVHAPGRAAPEDPGDWKPSTDLHEPPFGVPQVKLAGEMKFEPGGQAFSIPVIQSCALAKAEQSILGKAWYDRKVGVRVTMLGEAGTTAYTFDTPVSYLAGSERAPKADAVPPRPETGGVSICIARRAPSTVFVALHEPFENGQWRIPEFRRLAQTAEGLAVAVVGTPESGVADRVLLRFWGDHEKPLTLAGDGESFTFADAAFIRLGREKVEVNGNVQALKVKVEGQPRLFINGKEEPARVEDGCLVYPR